MKTQIPILTSLRFVAAMCIFTAHLMSYYIAYQDVLFGPLILKISSFGMTTFFVLSGFVIHWNYHDKFLKKKINNIHNYIVSRIARIYPLYLIMLFFYFAIQENSFRFLGYFPYY